MVTIIILILTCHWELTVTSQLEASIQSLLEWVIRHSNSQEQLLQVLDTRRPHNFNVYVLASQKCRTLDGCDPLSIVRQLIKNDIPSIWETITPMDENKLFPDGITSDEAVSLKKQMNDLCSAYQAFDFIQEIIRTMHDYENDPEMILHLFDTAVTLRADITEKMFRFQLNAILELAQTESSINIIEVFTQTTWLMVESTKVMTKELISLHLKATIVIFAGTEFQSNVFQQIESWINYQSGIRGYPNPIYSYVRDTDRAWMQQLDLTEFDEIQIQNVVRYCLSNVDTALNVEYPLVIMFDDKDTNSRAVTGELHGLTPRIVSGVQSNTVKWKITRRQLRGLRQSLDLPAAARRLTIVHRE